MRVSSHSSMKLYYSPTTRFVVAFCGQYAYFPFHHHFAGHSARHCGTVDASAWVTIADYPVATRNAVRRTYSARKHAGTRSEHYANSADHPFRFAFPSYPLSRCRDERHLATISRIDCYWQCFFHPGFDPFPQDHRFDGLIK